MIKNVFATLALSLIAPLAIANTLYISPSGDDCKGQGSEASPFKTLYRAQQELRDIVAKDADADVTILLAGGRYEIGKTLVLGFEDVAQSLTIKGKEGEIAELSAGANITGWRLCEELPEGAPASLKGKLYVADMPEGLGSFRTLFDGSKRLTRSASEKFAMPKDNTVERSDSQNVAFNKDRIHLRMVPFTDQLRDWDNIDDIEIFFNPVPWCMNFIALESVDMENKIGYLAYEANSMPFTANHGAYALVENAIDYLDEAGEWCVNTKSRKIYYYPESGKPSDSIYAPQLMEMVRVEGKISYDLPQDKPVKNIHFENLTFTHADRSVWYKDRKGWGIQHDWDTFDYGNAALRFRGAEDCSVEECRFTNTGGSAIRLDLHAQNIAIRRSMIDYVGHMGILLAGYGPGTKNVNKNNIIENNIIHHCGEVILHGHGIFAWQSGENTIRNNYIHDVPRKAIGLCGVRCQILMKPECNFDEASRTIRWSEIEKTIDMSNPKIIERYAPYLHARKNIVENNHVERTMLMLSDGSSINISGAGLGNIIRHNYLYDIPFVGIRTDDWQDGTIIESNLLHKIGNIGITYKGTNYADNNVIIDSKKAFHFRSYPKQYFESEGTFIKHNIVYSTHPQFTPNTIFKWGNMEVSRAGTKPMPYEYNMDYNSYWWSGAEEDLKLKRENGIEAHGVVMDPKFRNLEKRDYTITNKKLIKAIQFRPFDMDISSFGIRGDYPEQLKKYDPTL